MIVQGATITGTIVEDLHPAYAGLQLYLDSRDSRSWPGTGQTWYDLSGNGKHATFYKNVNGASRTAANEATAINGNVLLTNGQGDIRFDGSTANVQYQYAAGSNLGSSITQWTLNAWVYYLSWPTSPLMPTIITGEYTGAGAGTNTVNFCLTNYDGSAGSGQYIRAAFYDGTWRMGGTYNISLNTWYNVVGTYDGSNLKLYVNNVLQQTNAYTSTSMTSTLNYRIGRRWDDYDTFDAYIPVAMVYNRAISAAEVDQNFRYFRGRYGI